ncbi:DUF5370 family protein [Tuberibacillus sp. Marseille-P3662]|uniref:DUF5370 family protein n=1 Tax=Tuberibacillus sp. Marseille-P3662 TaxID=1965358 RepID=UPI000A1CC5DF|nr:DUF5370 family protein [Tuberibacillus sp. Marseille-P3662]
MEHIKKNGYEFEPIYSDVNKSGMLRVKNHVDGSLVRELHFPCKGDQPTDEEVTEAIDYFFEHLVY